MMARKNNFKKTKYANVFSLEKPNGKKDYYVNFMLNGITYQKKNLTKLFDSTTAKQASEKLEEIKSELRNGKDPFTSSGGDTVKDIVLADIAKKKPLNDKKDNSHYKRSLELFYNNHIHPIIGHLRLDKVKREHALKILGNLEGNTKSFKLTLNVLMFKIFEKEFRDGNIKSNPFYELDYGSHKPKASFDIRFNEPMESVAKRLYQTALSYRASHRLLLLMNIMTVRRIGELHQMRFSHINQYSDGSWYVIATEDITKTGIEEKYPLPSEVVELLPENVLDPEFEDEQLFSFAYSGMFKHAANLVTQADIQLNNGHKFTPHDNRYLFLSILASLGVDTDLADRCLSHNHKKEIKQIYLDTPYSKRKSIFEQWWEFLRN